MTATVKPWKPWKPWKPCANDKLLIATCRSPGPTSEADVALPAGKYTLWLLDPADTGASAAGASVPIDSPVSVCRRRHGTAKQLDQPLQETLPAGDVVLVIHGFNCDALGGIATVAQVRDSLCAWGQPVTEHGTQPVPGAVHVIGFTWPCQHTLFPGYLVDKATVARFAAFSLANLILDLRQKNEDRRIHVVAHSTGCFMLVKALNMVAVLRHHMTIKAPQAVNQVIWFAADINADALELTTPQTPLAGWRAMGRIPHLSRLWRWGFRNLLPPPRVSVATPTPNPPSTTAASTKRPDPPLDGYGYDAFGEMEALRSYSSVYDQALFFSPWVNLTTEETGAASALLRMGWCGPLHPALTMARPGHKPARRLALVECSNVVHEHSEYFSAPVVQCDMTACLYDAQRKRLPNPPAVTDLQNWRRWAYGARVGASSFPPKRGSGARTSCGFSRRIQAPCNSGSLAYPESLWRHPRRRGSLSRQPRGHP
jgi:hypothetical protein